MGWTSYHATNYKQNGRNLVIDRKAEIDQTFGECYEIVKSTMVGSIHYAAVRKVKKYVEQDEGTYTYIDIPKDQQYVFATVTLTSVNSDDYFNFSYKDMSESMGPCESNCPLSILKLLSPTSDCYALEWRDRCRKNAEHKKTIRSLPIGAIVRFEMNGSTREFVKHSPAFQFKRPFWFDPHNHSYIPSSRIPVGCEIYNCGLEGD